MIFVGDGALLQRAVQHAAARGHTVDLVCCGPRAAPGPHPTRRVTDSGELDALAGEVAAACTDGLVWSIDNPFVFRTRMLASGLRILNVHGGPLPGYRGIPAATVAYAVLHGEREFAATLHEVDAGLDTGPVLAERRFPVAPDAVFEDVMLDLVEAAHEVFVANLDPVLQGGLGPGTRAEGACGYYGLREARALPDHRDHPRYAQATELGLFEDFYPEAAAAWR
jgi:folate-dependent phosphoribosylglycinamide formyltransferase PurN